MGLTREKIIQTVNATTSLPSFPEVVIRLERELGKSEPSVAEVAKIVEQDPSLSARMLQVANSAFYHRAKKTTSIVQAVMRLGLIEARKVALATSIVEQFKAFGGSNPKQFWGHSLAVALATKVIVSLGGDNVDAQTAESAFAAGLLHDLGVLALFFLFPDECQALSLRLKKRGGVAADYEFNEWGIDHGEVGEILAKKWDLPFELTQVIRYHHRPWQSDPSVRQLSQLVHISNFVCNNQGFSRKESGFPDSFDSGAWDSLGLSLSNVEDIISQVKEEGSRSDIFMDVFN